MHTCTQVKHRIAVGLSKEGWAITRNLLTLASMIVLGIATLNYAMKEFCIIALVGLICDFFLQLVFFPTVLAIDLRRLEVRIVIIAIFVQIEKLGTSTLIIKKLIHLYSFISS